MYGIELEIYPYPSGEFDRFLDEEVWPDYNVNTAPLECILNGLKKWYREPCRTVVVERPYLDKDYLDEYTAFYAGSFRAYPHICSRLHFFSCRIPRRTYRRFDKYSASYLGFCVLRPTDLLRTGRSVLAFPDKDPENSFILARAEGVETHILTSEMSVSGTPFMQQETQVGVCATAATWMATRCMSYGFGYREYRPSEITRFAQQHFPSGRVFPAKSGLSQPQILDALRTMGLEAEFISRFDIEPSEFLKEAAASWCEQELAHWSLAAAVYRYVESRLPVILMTGHHAFVAIGHTYRPDSNALLAVQHLPALYINDDSRGPYLELPLDSVAPSGTSLVNANADRETEGRIRRRTFREVVGAILLSPPECTLSGQDAEDDALQLLRDLAKSLPLEVREEFRKELGGVDLASEDGILSELYCRTYLRTQLDVKRWYLEAPLPQRIRNTILRMCMPKYVWVVELSTFPLISCPQKANRKRLGEVIMDSTAPAGTGAALILRLGRFYILANRDDPEDIDVHWLFEDEAPAFLDQYVR